MPQIQTGYWQWKNGRIHATILTAVDDQLLAWRIPAQAFR
jgi:hypothetical protein